MKQKIIIALMVVGIALVIIFIAKDMFRPNIQDVNPYAYELADFKHIDESKIAYKELRRFKPNIQKIKGITIDEQDNLYLVGLQKLMIYDAKGEFIKAFRLEAEAQNIAISKSGEYVLGVSDHIEIWNAGGAKVETWKPYNDRSVITSIAIKDAFVFVADAGNKVVLKYNLESELLQEIGRKDTVAGVKGFVIPSPYFDLLIGRQGELWAVNSGLHQFEAYNEQGEQYSTWKKTSMQWDGFSGCCNPSHIALLSDGSFVTSEKGIVRIKVHGPDGVFKYAVERPDAFSEDTRGLDLAVDSKDRIYVIVPDVGEVRVYGKKESID